MKIFRLSEKSERDRKEKTDKMIERSYFTKFIIHAKEKERRRERNRKRDRERDRGMLSQLP